MAALSAAGLPTETFLFVGFLPVQGDRRGRSASPRSRAVPATLVLFESPNRIAATLADAAADAGRRPRRAICRELTKLHETFDRGTLGELAARYADADVKGEIVLLDRAAGGTGSRPRRPMSRRSCGRRSPRWA